MQNKLFCRKIRIRLSQKWMIKDIEMTFFFQESSLKFVLVLKIGSRGL